MQRAIIVTIFLLVSFVLSPLYAQQYYFRAYSTEDGLPQSEVRSLLADSHGNMWMGTQAGVARYNGKKFHTLTTTDGLNGYIVRALHEDTQGNIWMGTDEGINVYDGKKITSFEKKGYRVFLKINENSKGLLWMMALRQQQVRFLYLQKDSLVDLANQHPEFFKKNPLQFVSQGKGHSIYLNTTQGVFEFDGSKITSSPIQKLQLSQPNTFRQVVFSDKQGGIWVREVVSPQDTRLYRYAQSKIKKVVLPNNFPASVVNGVNVYEDSQQNIWFFNQSLGSLRYNISKQQAQVFNVSNGLPSNSIASLAEDREGNIWLGTANTGHGVLKFSGERFVSFDQRDGLKNMVTWSFLEDHQKKIWTGFLNNISSFDGKTIKNFPLNSTPTTRVSFLTQLPDQKILAMTILPSRVYELNGEKFTDVTAQFKLPAGPSTCYQEKDTLWIALSNGQIVKVLDKKIQTDKHWESPQINAPVFGIDRDPQGYFWINTINGLFKYDGKNLTTYTRKEGLRSNFIIQTLGDTQGRRWVACSNGLMVYEQGKFIDISAKITLPSDVLYSLVFDREQNLWVGTQNGPCKLTFDKKGVIQSITSYGKEEGYLAGEPNLAAAFVDQQGQVWFGGVKGVARYNPKADTLKAKAPRINITQVKLSLKPVAWNSAPYQTYHQGVSRWFPIPQKLRLPYDQNNISFDFEALCFHAPDQVSFQWRLEGLYKDWSPESTNQEAAYTNLPSGNYTFWVRARNSEGIWSKAQRVDFVILKPIWAKWWFRGLVLVLIAGLIYWVFRLRIQQIKRQKKRLEILVDEKTTEVVKQRDEILEKNEELTQFAEELAAQAENLKEANEEILRKNEDITASISYAERIQSAILPQLERIKQELPESFVFFKPRDIVSGDFYWFSTIQEQYVVLAAVDCTGHGVPGAFMSLIGNDLLNQVVNEHKNRQPHLILNQLHILVRQALKQDQTNNRDGMDMSVVVLDKASQTLHFAGAKNSLLYFQKGQMYQIKGDRLPIGGEQREDSREFTSHPIDVSIPTTFYLFSDGFQDQFGGKQGKKFMIAQFRQLLADIHHHPMTQQQTLLENNLMEWTQGSGQLYKQLDDILVIGVHLS